VTPLLAVHVVLAAAHVWTSVLAVFQVLLSVSLVGLILMHSGRDTGFGGMGFTPASQGGTHIVERNLTRLTVVVGVLFLANTVGLFHLLGK
jgi:preprotein translocase subunit SecG